MKVCGSALRSYSSWLTPDWLLCCISPCHLAGLLKNLKLFFRRISFNKFFLQLISGCTVFCPNVKKNGKVWIVLWN
jgi:hypothetical protein